MLSSAFLNMTSKAMTVNRADTHRTYTLCTISERGRDGACCARAAHLACNQHAWFAAGRDQVSCACDRLCFHGPDAMFMYVLPSLFSFEVFLVLKEEVSKCFPRTTAGFLFAPTVIPNVSLRNPLVLPCVPW